MGGLDERQLELAEAQTRQDEMLAAHDRHLQVINGSMGEMAHTLGQQATSLAVMSVSVKNIETSLQESAVGLDRRRTRSTQWKLAVAAIAGALLTGFLGFIGSLMIALLVLWANGKLG